MKKYFRLSIIYFVAALPHVFSLTLNAQADAPGKIPPEKREKLKAHKIAFITDRLQLTPAEAEKFWPVYNEHEASMEKLQKDFRKTHSLEPDVVEAMSDVEAIKMIEELFKHEQLIFDQRKSFISKLKGVIPAKKILMLMEAEKDFRLEVVRKVSGNDGPPLPYDEKRMERSGKK